MINKIVNYIKDPFFKIIYVNNSVNVINYDNILEVKSDLITLEKENNIIFIKGKDLKIDKLIDQEILIRGVIIGIEL